MTATFTVAAPKATEGTVYSNALGKLSALLVIKNVETKASNGSVEAEDDNGTPYIGAELRPGQAIAITVPANTANLQIFNLNDIQRPKFRSW